MHNNAEVMYHLEFQQYTKNENFKFFVYIKYWITRWYSGKILWICSTSSFAIHLRTKRRSYDWYNNKFDFVASFIGIGGSVNESLEEFYLLKILCRF